MQLSSTCAGLSDSGRSCDLRRFFPASVVRTGLFTSRAFSEDQVPDLAYRRSTFWSSWI